LKNKISKLIFNTRILAAVLYISQNDVLAVNAAASSAAPLSMKKTVIKFIIAMGGVAISSVLLYVGLTIYNRIRGIRVASGNFVERTPSEFDTPNTVQGAVEFFINQNRL